MHTCACVRAHMHNMRAHVHVCRWKAEFYDRNPDLIPDEPEDPSAAPSEELASNRAGATSKKRQAAVSDDQPTLTQMSRDNDDFDAGKNGDKIPGCEDSDGADSSPRNSAVGCRGGVAVKHFEEPRVIGEVMREKNTARGCVQIQVFKYVYDCKHCGKSIKQEGTSSGQLTSHIRKEHPDIIEEVELESKHTARRVRKGTLTYMRNFSEQWY